jgi:hypothetical protein
MRDVFVELFQRVGAASQGNLEGACKVLSMTGDNVQDFFSSVIHLRANGEPRPQFLQVYSNNSYKLMLMMYRQNGSARISYSLNVMPNE